MSGVQLRLRAVGVALLLAGCLRGGGSAGPSPTDCGEPVVLAGTWRLGVGDEPPPGPVTDGETCISRPEFHALSQDGPTLRAIWSPRYQMRGIPPREQLREELAGQVCGSEVTLTGWRWAQQLMPGPTPEDPQREAVEWRLSYDAASGHLRGTRNGEPGWGAPLTVLPPGDCRDHPPPP